MTAINGPLADAIGLAILHLLWQGAAVALGLAVALRLLSRSTANLRYVVSCLALTALLIFGVTTAYQSYDVAPPVTIGPAADIHVVTIASSLSKETATEPAGIIASVFTTLRMHSATIATVWLLGVILLATRLTVSWTRTRNLLVAGATPAAGEWQRVIDRLAGALGIKRAIQLLESAAVDVPSVIGFLKPVVLVPASSLSGLSPRQLELILAHELAHIRRHDFVVNMLQSVAETLLFYHPAAWWISHQIRVERENCCDDLAVKTCGNAVEYARALTVLEELRGMPSLAVAANGGSLLGRVRRLVGHREHKLVNGWTAIAAAVSFAVVMTITSLPVHADREEAQPLPPVPPSTEIEVVAPAPPAPPPAKRAPRVVVVAPVAPPHDIAVDFDYDYESVDVEPPEIPDPPQIRFRTRAPLAPPAMPMAFAHIDMAEEDDDEAEEEETSTTSASQPRRLTIDELITLRIHNVTPQYITEMRSLFGPLSVKNITGLRIMNVSSKYVSDMRAAGVEVKTWKDALSLKTHDVTPQFARAMIAAGYSNLSARDLVRLAIAGVDADFIREMQKYRDQK